MISLREFESSDAATVQKLLNDVEVSRYLSSRIEYITRLIMRFSGLKKEATQILPGQL